MPVMPVKTLSSGNRTLLDSSQAIATKAKTQFLVIVLRDITGKAQPIWRRLFTYLCQTTMNCTGSTICQITWDLTVFIIWLFGCLHLADNNHCTKYCFVSTNILLMKLYLILFGSKFFIVIPSLLKLIYLISHLPYMVSFILLLDLKVMILMMRGLIPSWWRVFHMLLQNKLKEQAKFTLINSVWWMTTREDTETILT